MQNTVRRPLLSAVLIGFALLLITLLDIVLPGAYLLSSLYAFPLIIAAFTLGPRGTAAAAVATIALVGLNVAISQPPVAVSLFGLTGAFGIGALAVQFSREQRRVIRRSIEREAAQRQVTEILESIGDGFFALDHAGCFTYVNQQAERVLGLDRRTVIGAPAGDCYPVGIQAAFEQVAEQCASQHEPVHIETYDRANDRWYEVHVYPSATGLSFYFRDFTARKLAEDAWREAEAKYRSLVEQVPAVTYRVEKRLGDGTDDTLAEYISPQFETMLGHKAADWIASPKLWADHIYPDDRERVLEANEHANRTGEPLHAEYRLIAADGRALWVRDQAMLVGPDDIKRHVWQGVMFDISAEKEIEADRIDATRKFAFLAETSRRLTAMQLDIQATLQQMADLLVPNVADCAIVYDMDGPTMRRAASASSCTEDRQLMDQIDNFRLTMQTRQRIHRYLQTGEPLVARTLDGSSEIPDVLSTDELRQIASMPVGSLALMPVRARGILLGSVLLIRKLSTPAFTPDDIRFIQEIVHRYGLILDNARLYQEARTALASREEFLSVAAHELRTPLTSIKGYVQLLERRLNRETPSIESLRQTIDNLRQPLGRFERIVEDLLEVTRTEQTELTIYRAECDLSEIVSNVFNGYIDSTDDALQEMRLVVPKSLRGFWDATRIAQVVENLLSNAVRYSLGRGEVLLRVTQQDGYAIISISDEGIGISEVERRHVFDPFYRSESVAGKVEGSGLGLAIAKRIVERHDGTIEVESRLGRGSTFTVRLPIIPVDVEIPPTPLVEELADY